MAGLLNATEISGAFVGFEVGNGTAMRKSLDNESVTIQSDATVLDYRLNAGYKHFFNEWLGVRAGLGFGYAAAINGDKMTSNTNGATAENQTTSDFFTYGLNADVLASFYSDEVASFGAFVGVGLGGMSYKYTYKVIEAGKTTSTESISANGFYADARVGLRLQAANHGVDLGARIPFTQSKGSKNVNGTEANITAKQNFVVSLGYSYTF